MSASISWQKWQNKTTRLCFLSHCTHLTRLHKTFLSHIEIYHGRMMNVAIRTVLRSSSDVQRAVQNGNLLLLGFWTFFHHFIKMLIAEKVTTENKYKSSGQALCSFHEDQVILERSKFMDLTRLTKYTHYGIKIFYISLSWVM